MMKELAHRLLATDMVRMSKRMDKAVLVSADTDFIPAIRALRDEGVNVVLCMYGGKVTPDLVEAVDEVLFITQDLINKSLHKRREYK